MIKDVNVVWQEVSLNRRDREERNGHRSAIIWLTGLSGAGKSTLANALEQALFRRACHTYVCDGDNLRHGLCGDLGFTEDDRVENIRRVGELAKLLMDAGIIAITAFISPYRADRRKAKQLVGAGDFIEVFCRCPLEICEQRDVKGLYRRARAGEIANFTGITAPYEEPEAPDVIIDTHVSSIETSVEQILAHLRSIGVLRTEDAQ